MGDYQWEATSLEGFVQQVAVCYVGRGYFHYVTGWVPPKKDPTSVDKKLIGRYKPDITKWARARRKKAGLANLQYIRLDRFFTLLATEGKHAFFEDEAPNICDARRVALRVGGYTISYRCGHPHVRIAQQRYRELKAVFLDQALRRPAAELAARLSGIPFEPYAPVRQQLFGILRALNPARKAAGLEPVPSSCIRLTRRIYRPFERRRDPSSAAQVIVPGGFILPPDIEPEVRRFITGPHSQK